MTPSEIKELNQVNQLIEDGKIKEALLIVLELEQSGDLIPQELLSYRLLKAELLRRLGNFLDAIKISDEIFQEFQKQGDILSAFDALLIQAFSYMMTVNISKSEYIIKQADDLFNIIKEKYLIDLKERESFLVRIKAGIHHCKGELQTSLELNKRAYDLAKGTWNNHLIYTSLNNIADQYWHMKEYDKAIKYAKKAIKIEPSLLVALGTLIDIYISKGDIKEAKIYLDQLRYHSEKFGTQIHRNMYLSLKASILKSSLRARDRIKAEDIFKEFALDDTLVSEPRIYAIIHLCDLYLTELQITNDPEIINDIRPYIQKLLNIAEDQHLYLYLAETYLLQAKLSLLTLDTKEAKRFLTQAQKIAESYGIKRLAMKISYEHDELLRQTKMWENLKISEMSLSERLKLTGLKEQVEFMVRKQMIKAPELSEEMPMLLLILSEGGLPLFSHSFTKEKSVDSEIFGGFLTTIDYFIKEMFSEGLDRAVFGDYTLVMKSIPPFFISYIFKGDSYYALQKTDYFIDQIQKEGDIWKNLLKSFELSKSVRLKDIPSLESLINETFTTRTLYQNSLI
ncbi:MAG: tetratricopeptide repeat protein [Candidatus Hermodarchaeota archaeon]